VFEEYCLRRCFNDAGFLERRDRSRLARLVPPLDPIRLQFPRIVPVYTRASAPRAYFKGGANFFCTPIVRHRLFDLHRREGGSRCKTAAPNGPLLVSAMRMRRLGAKAWMELSQGPPTLNPAGLRRRRSVSLPRRGGTNWAAIGSLVVASKRKRCALTGDNSLLRHAVGRWLACLGFDARREREETRVFGKRRGEGTQSGGWDEMVGLGLNERMTRTARGGI